jgi:predicted heme/steroid binding protein
MTGVGAEELHLTEQELRQFNGERGQRAYIAYQGVIYDVTDAPNWRGSMHREMHYPGLDLTRSLRKAPHDEGVFRRVLRVGTLVVNDAGEARGGR